METGENASGSSPARRCFASPWRLLRNPLNVAEGSLDLLREECESDHLDRIERAHTRMQRIIADLLELARQGDTVHDPEVVDATEVATEAWTTVETDKATVQIDWDVTLMADPGRLQQVFENLFGNAVEHAGPDVTVEVGALAGRAGFYVADNGPGIPADEREQVFERGYSTSEEGTGFGLAIVGEIVEAHGWEITVTESEAGGARFEISCAEIEDTSEA